MDEIKNKIKTMIDANNICQKIFIFAERPSLELNLSFKKSSKKPRVPKEMIKKIITQRYLFPKSPQHKQEKVTAAKIKIPPIVGVPFFS